VATGVRRKSRHWAVLNALRGVASDAGKSVSQVALNRLLASLAPSDYVFEFIAGANSRPDRRGQGAED
jgi:aryl-alcohol dehydrogenase-like predicted oxidoreductase